MPSSKALPFPTPLRQEGAVAAWDLAVAWDPVVAWDLAVEPIRS
ncbi:hypothetical protein CCP3SC15_5790003 [Gammaproteobacteria bacterium]